MKIAVTGASGNLGTLVVRVCIAHGHTVIGIDKAVPREPPQIPENAPKDTYRFVELDVRDYHQVSAALAGNDAVIHLAALAQPGDYLVDTHNLNVVASWNVLRACAELGIERICQASSINAIGLVWGDNPIVDYLPIDENHPCRPEDPYSLSKLICELQADTIIRRWPNMRIASIRLSWAVPNREYAMGRDMEWVRKELWGWVDAEESARAFMLGVTAGDWRGHEPFFICAPDTCQDELTMELVREHWPTTEIRREVSGNDGLYDCSKAGRLLNWYHKPTPKPQQGGAPATAVESAPADEPLSSDESSPSEESAPQTPQHVDESLTSDEVVVAGPTKALPTAIASEPRVLASLSVDELTTLTSLTAPLVVEETTA